MYPGNYRTRTLSGLKLSIVTWVIVTKTAVFKTEQEVQTMHFV